MREGFSVVICLSGYLLPFSCCCFQLSVAAAGSVLPELTDLKGRDPFVVGFTFTLFRMGHVAAQPRSAELTTPRRVALPRGELKQFQLAILAGQIVLDPVGRKVRLRR